MKSTMIPLARREMLRAARRYERDEPGLGDRFLDEVRAGLLAILEFPGAHPPLDPTYRRKLLSVFPYSLVYRTDGNAIVIIAVANSKRRPGYWRRRRGAGPT